VVSKISLSVVICTHRRFDLLKIAVQSLCNQTASKELFEVIIVDNDSTSNTGVKNIVKEAQSILTISYIHEPVLGLSQARNSGGKASQAEFVGFLDDDAKAHENYVEILLKLIGTDQFDIIGGPYYPFYLSKKPIWFKDEYESCNFGRSRTFNNTEFLNGTNMVYKKSLLEGADWFGTSFGMAGTRIAYGEETDLQIRLWKKFGSLKVYYSSDLKVNHLVPSHKMKLRDKFRRSYNLGKSQAYMWIPEEQIRASQRKAPLILFKSIVKLIFILLPGIIIRNKRKYPDWQNYAYEVISRHLLSIGQTVGHLSNYS
jgi:glucosyl-dolichyl phosphate glucuronosyltransferase